MNVFAFVNADHELCIIASLHCTTCGHSPSRTLLTSSTRWLTSIAVM